MKNIIIGTLCVLLFASSNIYSLTRAEMLLANSLKKQIDTLIKTKPEGWQVKADKLVKELETSSVPKGYDPLTVANLKKEINPVVVVTQETIKPDDTSAASKIDKESIIKQLDAQLALSSVDNVWHEKVDDLLFELSKVDRALANEYSKKVREKTLSIYIKKEEPQTKKEEPQTKKEEPQIKLLAKEKTEEKKEVHVPVVGEPMLKGNRPGPGSGKRPIPVKKEGTVVSSVVPVKKEEVVVVQPKGSQKNLAAIEDELKQLLQEPADQRATDWLQNVNDLIFELSVFDSKKAAMYLEEIYALKTSKSTKTTTTTVVQKEPERPKVFGTKAPFFGSVKNMADNKILETFNKYLSALSDSWVKGADGGSPAQWWSNDIKVFERVIKEKKIEVRIPEEIEKEFVARTTKEAMTQEIQREKDKAIADLKAAIEKEAIGARQGKSAIEKSEITKTFNKKRDEGIAKIKTSSINEGEIKERIQAAVKVFSPENVSQKIETKIARIKAENQAAEKGFTLDELEGLVNELTEEIREKNSSLNEKQIQQLVAKELPEAKKVLLEDKQKELQELSKQLFEEIKKENSSLSDREVQAIVKQKLPQAKKDLDAKKQAEIETLTQRLTEEVKKGNSSLSEEAVAKLVKEKLQQIKKNERVKKEEQRVKDIAAKELEELIQAIDKLFVDQKGDVQWILGIRGKIKELNKLDTKKAKAYQAQFLEIAPGEKPFL